MVISIFKKACPLDADTILRDVASKTESRTDHRYQGVTASWSLADKEKLWIKAQG